MNKHFKKSILPFAISLGVASLLLITHLLGKANTSFFSIPRTSVLQEVKMLVSKRYMENISLDSMTSSSIDSVLMKLDPHSRYIPAQELQGELEGIKGMFYGIGVEYSIINDSLNIVQVLPESPALKAGLLVGDILTKAGDSSISGSKKTTAQIRNILTGKRGSSIELSVKRQDKILQLSVERKEVDVNSVDASFMVAPNVGYIKLNRFTSKTYREFMMALMELKKQPVLKLILDLRDNGGGVLEEAVEIADEFLDGDKLISYTEGFHSPKEEYRCRRLGQFEEGKLIILCNQYTASASEILMGALQDWDRATIIGKRSFGKGLLQEQYNLNDGGALRLTIARYYTPMGRSIQRSYSDGKKSYYDAAVPGKINDSAQKDTRQITLTKSGKKLFDHSGITPEIIIENDSAKISEPLLKLLADDASSNFGYRYYVKHKELKTKFGSVENFQKSFIIDDEMWNFYNQSLSDINRKRISTINTGEQNMLRQFLKTSLAAQLFGKTGYYKSISTEDKLIQKAITL